MVTIEMIEELESETISRAFLYGDPISYREGVEAAMIAIRAELARRELEPSGARRTA